MKNTLILLRNLIKNEEVFLTNSEYPKQKVLNLELKNTSNKSKKQEKNSKRIPWRSRVIEKDLPRYEEFNLEKPPMPVEWIKKDPGSLKTLSKTYLKIYSVYVYLDRIRGLVYPSHEYVAKVAGCCVSTVKKAIKAFKALGLLATFHHFNKTSYYKISPWFYDYKVRVKLWPLISALVFTPLWLLWAPLSKPNIKQLRIKKNYSYLTKLNITVHMKAINIKSTSYREREVMYEKSSHETMRTILKAMTLIDWTDERQKMVDHYSDEILQYAYEVLKRKPEVTSRFSYFLATVKKRQEQPSLSSVTNYPSKPQTGFFKKTGQGKESYSKENTNNGNMNDSRYLEYPEYLQPTRDFAPINDARGPMRLWYKKHINLGGPCEECFSCLTGGMKYWLRYVDNDNRNDFLRRFPFLNQIIGSATPYREQVASPSEAPVADPIQTTINSTSVIAHGDFNTDTYEEIDDGFPHDTFNGQK